MTPVIDLEALKLDKAIAEVVAEKEALRELRDKRPWWARVALGAFPDERERTRLRGLPPLCILMFAITFACGVVAELRLSGAL